MTSNTVTRNAMSIAEFVERNSISRASFYVEVSRGNIDTMKVGSRTLVTFAAERDWLDRCSARGRRSTNNAMGEAFA